MPCDSTGWLQGRVAALTLTCLVCLTPTGLRNDAGGDQCPKGALCVCVWVCVCVLGRGGREREWLREREREGRDGERVLKQRTT